MKSIALVILMLASFGAMADRDDWGPPVLSLPGVVFTPPVFIPPRIAVVPPVAGYGYPAYGYGYRQNWRNEHEWREHEWREHERREHRHQGHGDDD